MFAAADAPRAGHWFRNVGALRRSMQGTGHLRELQGDPGFTISSSAPRDLLEMRQGLAKAGPRFCVSNLGHYYYIPAEFGTVRIEDVSQATRFRIYEVERPQLCTFPETPAPRPCIDTPRQ